MLSNRFEVNPVFIYKNPWWNKFARVPVLWSLVFIVHLFVVMMVILWCD
jgi:hypothetical protein